MKPFLLLLLFPLFFAAQQVEREEPDLQVVKFSWVKEKQKSQVIRGAQNPGGPIVSPQTGIQDQATRGVDLRTMEKKAAGSAVNIPESYQLLLELRNTGINVVRGLVWEYRPTAGHDDYQPKQYLCALAVQPKEKKVLDIWTPYIPLKVVSADAKNLLKEGTVTINQIVYVDGSVWKKRGWDYRLPADSLGKLADGQCSVF